MNTNESIWAEWYNRRMDEAISDRLKKLSNLLSRNRLLSAVATETIKEEIANSIDSSELSEELIKFEKSLWLENIGIKKENQTTDIIMKRIEKLNITYDQMNQQCEIEAKVYHWAIKQWEGDLPTMYLEKKDKFDIATFRIIRFEKDQYKFGNEIYHRIKNKELTFKEACMIHGAEQDRLSRGRPISQPINEINPSIRERINYMKPGQLSQPFKIPDWLIMTELLNLKTSTLDSTTKRILIKQRLNSYLSFGAIKVASAIKSSSTTKK